MIDAAGKPGCTVVITAAVRDAWNRVHHPPLRRLRKVGRVIVAGARDPSLPRHLGWDVAESVEEAVARAMRHHGADATIGVVEQPAMPADPDRA